MTELYDLLFKSPEGVTLACDMLVIGTMLAISAAQNITNYQQQKYDAEAAAKKQDQNAALQQQMTHMEHGDAQERKQALLKQLHQEESELQRRSLVMRGSFQTSAGEAGVQGQSFDAGVNEYLSRQAQVSHASQTQADLASARIDQSMDRITLSGGTRLSSIFRPINQASGAKAMLDFASDSANIAGDYKGKRGAFAEG